KKGGQMLHATSTLLDFYGTSQKSADFRSGSEFLFEEAAVKETSPGSGQYVENDILIDPANAFAYFNRLNNISESSIRDNSFVKLREVTIGYPVYSNTRFTVD